MNFTFGPINSRRFGLSLGIDLSPDTKRCNFDCLYCELEASKTTNSHESPPNVEDILTEVKKALTKYPNIDVITITANGEPTLYPYLDELIDKLNFIKQDKKLLILSNASRIGESRIQQTLSKLDIVKLSVDSVNEQSFKKIDRQHSDIKLEDIKLGIKEFAKNNAQKLVLEVLFVKGVNDSEKDIDALIKFLEEINPSRVDIGTIDRPPAYKVESISNEKLINISKKMKKLNVSIAYKKSEAIKKMEYSEDEIIKLLKRRPLSQNDIELIFCDNSKTILKKLIEKNTVKIKNQNGVSFYSS